MELVVQENIPLAPYTTLHIGGSADKFIVVTTKEQLHEVREYARVHNLAPVVLGGGSNVLVSDEGYRGLVVLMRIVGMQSEVKEGSVYLKVGAGEVLDEVVLHAVERGWWGIENLSHIPGTVGATPVQNVGAYGVEVSKVLTEVEVFDMESGAFSVLDAAACRFGYRDSLFKSPEGKKYIITSVTFKLSTTPAPQVAYKDLAARFPQADATLQEIRNAIIAIRSEKFPDWTAVGTAGSFFKNPVVSQRKAGELSALYPELPQYPSGNDEVKISLGFVLDKLLALRGYTEGGVGLFEKQALVLIADRGTRSEEVKRFAEKIIARVEEKIGVHVEMEVTVLESGE